MLGEKVTDRAALAALANAIGSVGTDAHVERLIDLIGTLVPHDRVTVVRYSVTERPEFVSYRNYSAAMVRKYLERYYVYDPFYAYWRENRRPGIVALRQWRAKPGPYIAEFLGESAISDEVGVLLNDGPGWCLGIFLDLSRWAFTGSDIKRLEDRFPVFAALHDIDIKSRSAEFKRTKQTAAPGREPAPPLPKRLPEDLWPSLSRRERQIAQLILEGHPTAAIAAKLGIAAGTAKNHRRSIYEKLDITTERELFLGYIDHMAAQG